jgi:hypothetical protein
MRAIWGVAMLAAACASTKDGSQTSSSNGASTVSAAPAKASTVVPATGEPEQIASAKGGVVESDAAILKRLGGTYLCDQRIYPQGGGAHITAWEWAFPIDPSELANALARELPGSQREEQTFGFKNPEGKPDVVVGVDTTERSKLGCKDIPTGSKSLVMVSRR